MNNKYLILLLFIFLVFLMGSINSTITNNFYNNTTGSQDHYNLTNLSYADSGHTGFQSSDTLDGDVSALGYVTNATMAHDSEKVNKTFDTMTTKLNISGNITDYQQKMSVELNQYWNFNLHNTGVFTGFLMGNFYNASAGSVFGGYKSRSYANGSIASIKSGDYMFYFFGKGWDGRTEGTAWPYSSGRFYIEASGDWNETNHPTQIRLMTTEGNDVYHYTRFLDNGALQIDAMAGSGNRPLCADSNGKIIICP